MKKVERMFLGAGTMRAGTTWFWNIVKDHPELYFTPQKELHFLHDFYQGNRGHQSLELPIWDRHYIVSPPDHEAFETAEERYEKLRYLFTWALIQLDYSPDYEYYHRLFSLRGNERYCCDMSNLTSHLEQYELEDIKHHFDEVKVLYMMRDPLTRLWSHFTYNQHQPHANPPFDPEAWSEEDILEWMNGGNILVKPSTDYTTSVRKLMNVFGENFKVIFYEDMLANPRYVLKTFEEFLGISEFEYSQEKIDKKVNMSTGQNEIWPKFRKAVMPYLRRQVADLSNFIQPSPRWNNYENSS